MNRESLKAMETRMAAKQFSTKAWALLASMFFPRPDEHGQVRGLMISANEAETVAEIRAVIRANTGVTEATIVKAEKPK